MATLEAANCVQQIGETAGDVWRLLSEESEPVSLAQLVKRIDQPRDLIMQAVGWLAREGKVQIEENGRTRYVALAQGE
ncbi:MAG: winged helix-turn-helix domain-containing protein [Planctomycetales bacterium]|nr:winged helix-turn-helix domain-containing protein [Planctomycetales bacterium]